MYVTHEERSIGSLRDAVPASDLRSPCEENADQLTNPPGSNRNMWPSFSRTVWSIKGATKAKCLRPPGPWDWRDAGNEGFCEADEDLGKRWLERDSSVQEVERNGENNRHGAS
ncbi:hypothetical protein ROHU_027719 [Labeo rohita]|uniref:Uncharacterized protein n=1 Tax=Labeo rohita TaxID=84645 RepID=A0A498M685_LABRO|nr:hypothetical protein ROHU_027719 [Labeo rohita]